MICSFSQSMAEQLAENYHNTWGRKKRMELQSKGERSLTAENKVRTQQSTGNWLIAISVCISAACRRRHPPFASTLRHPDGKRKGSRSRKGSWAPQISSTQWICCHKVKRKLIVFINLERCWLNHVFTSVPRGLKDMESDTSSIEKRFAYGFLQKLLKWMDIAQEFIAHLGIDGR